MKKKVFYLFLCAVLVWLALVSWNWSVVFSQRLSCSHLWFDMLSVVLFIGAIAASGAATGKDCSKTE